MMVTRTLVFLQFVAIGTLFAQNKFSHEQISVLPNSEFSVEVLATTQDSVGAFQLDLDIDNSSITFASEAVEKIDNTYSLSYNLIDDTKLRVVGYTASADPVMFNNEPLFKINLISSNNPGDFYLDVSNFIASDNKGNQIEINFENSLISIIGPKLSLDSQQINFDKIGLNSKYNSSFYIRNDGNESLDVDSIDFPDVFEVEQNVPLRVSAGETRYINFSLDTTQEIVVNDSITFVTNDTDIQRTSQSIKVQGEIFSSNILGLSNASANNRETATINLNLENQEECFGVQLDVVLPNNFEFDSDNLSLSERAAGFLISSSKINENTHRLLVFSTTKESIKPGNGSISLFKITPDTNAGSYNIEIQNAIAIGANQENILTDFYGSTFNVFTPVFRVDNEMVNLGEFNSNTTKDFKISTHNDSDQDVVIDSLEYNNSVISIEGISFPRKLIPFDNLNIDASFTSGDIGEFNEQIKIYHNGDNSPSSINVRGTILGQNFLFSDDVFIDVISNEYVLKINIQNDEQIRGIQFDLNVSEEVNLDFENLSVLPSLENFTVSNSTLNGKQRFIIFTTTNTTLPKGSNPMIQIPISTEQINGNYEVLFEEVFISNSTNSNVATSPSIIGSVEIDIKVPPSATSGQLTTEEDTPTSLDLGTLSSDQNADTLTYTVTNPTNGTVALSEDGIVTYTPTENYNGDDSFTFTVSDGTETATETISVTVTAVNDAPTAAAGSIATTEDTAGTLDLTTLSSDVDEDTLTYTVADPTYGKVELSGGIVTYTPNDNFFGSDSFTYSVSDNTKTTIDYTISVTINSINDIPTSGPTAVTIEEDTIVDIDISELISDVEDDGLTVVIESNPTQGNVSLIETGFKYIPKADYSGTDAFAYFVVDSEGAKSNISEVKITVNDVNDAPIASDINSSTNQDTALILTVDVSDKDSEFTNLQLVVDQGPSKGQITVDGFNIKYTPDSSYSGVDSFTYYVLDTTDSSVSDIHTVNITVLEVGEILEEHPTVASLVVNGFQDTPKEITLQGTDPNSLELIYEISSAPLNGTVTIDGNKATYIPPAGYFGEDSFLYSATNTDSVSSSTAMITIEVHEKPNKKPTAFSHRYSVFAGKTVSFNLEAKDPENDKLTYLMKNSDNLSSTVKINADTGETQITHSGVVGEETFTFIVRDGTNKSEEATITIEGIQKPNSRPHVFPKLTKLKKNSNTDYSLKLTSPIKVLDKDGFTDIDKVEIKNKPAYITEITHEFDTTNEVVKKTMAVSFESSKSYNEVSTIDYVVKDKEGLESNDAVATIVINEVENTAPTAVGYDIQVSQNSSTTSILLIGHDHDGDNLTFDIVGITNATYGNIVIGLENTKISTATTQIKRIDDSKDVSIRYTVDDGNESSSHETINIKY
jgi:hypothetical protein